MISLSMYHSIQQIWYSTPKTAIVLHEFMEIIIKLIMIMVQTQNWKNWLIVILIRIYNLLLLGKNICQLGFRSKIEMPQLGSAQLGKFQLELITTRYLIKWNFSPWFSRPPEKGHL